MYIALNLEVEVCIVVFQSENQKGRVGLCNASVSLVLYVCSFCFCNFVHSALDYAIDMSAHRLRLIDRVDSH